MNHSNDLTTWIEEAIAHWEASDTKLHPGATIAQIHSVEEIIQFKFPPDFIELYQQVNGFRDFDWNQHMFSFWPLEIIIDEYKSNDDKNFVGFCDFLFRSHEIGFSKTAAGIYKHYDLQHPIAQTFKEAVLMINNSSDTIY